MQILEDIESEILVLLDRIGYLAGTFPLQHTPEEEPDPSLQLYVLYPTHTILSNIIWERPRARNGFQQDATPFDFFKQGSI